MEPRKLPQPDPTLRQSKTALLAAAQAAVADQKSRVAAEPAGPARRSRTALRVVLAALIAAAATVLVLRPGWLVGPGLPVETPAVQTASATLSLVDAVSRIKAYVGSTGALPATPAAAGVTNPAIVLRPLGSAQFEVSLPAGDSLISLRSTDSLEARVVDAVVTLQRRS